MKKTEKDYKEELTPKEYKVLRKGGTEMPFIGKYNNFKEKGIYEIEVEILIEKETISTIFFLQVTTKSLLEDITFYITLGISIIIIMLIIINRFSHINKK